MILKPMCIWLVFIQFKLLWHPAQLCSLNILLEGLHANIKPSNMVIPLEVEKNVHAFIWEFIYPFIRSSNLDHDCSFLFSSVLKSPNMVRK
jgi:hypothetical protein